jgi:hexosaminidase
VVQVWGAIGPNHPAPLKIAQQGNPTLISKGFYLDYFLPAYIHYQNPHIPTESNANILGGEAALWSELVDENSFEGRAWPRTAVVAERLWSSESVKDIDDMYQRLFKLNDKLEEAGLNHRLNSERMFSALCNGQSGQKAFKILETLAPARGYGRLLASFTAPEQTKYQQVPLVDLNDLVACDSETAWSFRKEIEKYLNNKDNSSKTNIIQQLTVWKEAAMEIPSLSQKAPNLKELTKYASKVTQITDIGLKILEKSPDESEKEAMFQTLKTIKSRGDKLEIQILPEIQALLIGKLPTLPTGF